MEDEIKPLEERFEIFLKDAESQINSLKTELNEITDIFEDFIKKPSSTVLSKAEKLQDTFDKVLSYNSEIIEIEKKTIEFEKKIFGKDESDANSLNNQLKELKENLNELYNEWNEQYIALGDKIEDLLPGATTAGLAKSYYDQKKSYKYPNLIWSIVFSITMLGMVTYAVLSLHDAKTLQEAFMNILSRTPFFVPTIWLALFASKQQSQNKRLEEEYAYKESLAKSYEGFKREVDKLSSKTDKDELMEKLLNAMVETASFNPSSTLEKKTHHDSAPIFGNLFSKKKENE